MSDLIKRDDALKACMLREDNPATEMQLSLRNVISALPAIDPTDRIEQLEAKLAKAVDALRFYSPKIIDGIEFRGGDDAGRTAAAVLAELEGQP